MTDAVSQMEPTDDVYKTLLESTKAIPWKNRLEQHDLRLYRATDRGAAGLGTVQLGQRRGLGGTYAPGRPGTGTA